MARAVTYSRTVHWVAWLLLLASGCSTAERALQLSDPLQATAAEAERSPSVASRHELTLERANKVGEPLHLRCVVYPENSRDPLAIHDSSEIARIPLRPGRYRVMIFADPLPFGFDVVMTADRPRVGVQIFSARSSHLVVTDVHARSVGKGLVLAERQFLGFGWGEPPVPHDRVDAVTASARQAREDMLGRRVEEEENAARRAARRIAAPLETELTREEPVVEP